MYLKHNTEDDFCVLNRLLWNLYYFQNRSGMTIVVSLETIGGPTGMTTEIVAGGDAAVRVVGSRILFGQSAKTCGRRFSI